MAFDESGFSGMFDLMNPQGNPLEYASMAAHQPEGLIPQLAAEGITPSMFENRFPQFMGGGGDLTSGQLLNAGMRLPFGVPSLTGPEQAVGPVNAPLVPTPVQTQSFLKPLAGGGPAPGAEPGAEPPAPAETPPGYADTPKPAGVDPAKDAKAQAENTKKISELTKMLAALKMPAAPQVQLPRPGTAGPPALRPINPQSAITALLAQALGQPKAAPSLSSLVRR